MKTFHSRFLVLATFTGATSISPASAQTRTKADNTNSLSQASSYVENTTVPSSTISLIIDNTLTTSRTSALGADLAIKGITMNAVPVSGATRQFQISNTPGAVLTIGGDGVTKAANTSSLIFSNAVTLGEDQTWTLNSVTGTGTGNLQMNGTFSDGGKTLLVTGNGIFDLRGSNTFGSNVTIDSNVSVNSAAAIVTLGGANTLNILNVPSGRVIGATIKNFGEASNFGDGGTNSAIVLGNTTNGIMEYSGVTASSNRTISRDGRSAASGIEVSTIDETLTISGNLGSGNQVNTGNSGWVFGGAGNLTLNGVISNSSGAGSTGTTITKYGSGVLTLGSSSNTFSGAITITSGKLSISSNGNVNSSSGITIGTASTAASSEFNYNASTALSKSVVFAAGATGGVLSGTGTINQAVSITTGNTLAIGNSPGTMSFADTLSLSGAIVMEIDGAAGAGLAGGHDFANLTGSDAAGVLTYGGSMTLDIGAVFGEGSHSWDLFNMASKTGTFSAIALADNYSGSLLDSDFDGVWDLSSGDNTWQFNESTGVLGLTVIPEPSAAALVGSLGMLSLLRRRRA
jgi:fibronectin-binding autotransporter adhesin